MYSNKTNNYIIKIFCAKYVDLTHGTNATKTNARLIEKAFLQVGLQPNGIPLSQGHYKPKNDL